MELIAVIEALSALNDSCEVNLITDSKYVKDGITLWLDNWKQNGWKTASKKAVKNQDLWLKLDGETLRHKINWSWVKGHSGNSGNERADKLANIGMEEMTESDHG